MDIEKINLDRRHALILTGGVVAGLALAGCHDKKDKPGLSQNTLVATPETTTIPPAVPDVFEDNDANEVAKKLKLKPGDFFKFSLDILNRLAAFRDDKLYPIYPPAVLAHRKLIYDLSDAYERKIPPNVIATIMAIESAGNKDVASWVGAQGLFQVMPFHFPEEIRNNPQTMREPYLNGRAGMNFFVNNCLPPAVRKLSNFSPNHVVVYARALIGYNAGPIAAEADFGELPDETKFYGDHFIRFALTAEVAKHLAEKGFKNDKIVAKLSTRELDARAFAIDAFREGAVTRGIYTYDLYDQALNELKKPIPGENGTSRPQTTIGKELQEYYKYYLVNPVYKLPIAPALRIWLALGGLPLFQTDPRNMDINSWKNLRTRRE